MMTGLWQFYKRLSPYSIVQKLKNEALRCFPSVLLVNEQGILEENPLKPSEILERINKQTHDLILVNEHVLPFPIVKIIQKNILKINSNYENTHENKRLVKNEVKDIYLGTTIGENDFRTKISKSLRLLNGGYRVRFLIEPKGKLAREIGSKQVIYNKIIDRLNEKLDSFEIFQKPEFVNNTLCFAVKLNKNEFNS